MKPHTHAIVNQEIHTHAIDGGKVWTRRQDRILCITFAIAMLLLSPLFAWLLGRAWEFEKELHSDAHWAQYGYADEIMRCNGGDAE